MIDLKLYGFFGDGAEGKEKPDNEIPGRIVEHKGSQYKVVTERGELAAELRGAFLYGMGAREEYPCVGDYVLLQYNDKGASRITRLLPRRSKFSRADFSGHAAGYAKTILEQVVAANFDYVFILSSLNWDFNVNRVMRYITQTMESGGEPVVLLTKADLAGDYGELLADIREAAPNVPVHAVSAHTGYGLEDLNAYLRQGVTVVFLGMSGVGKSSLLNALMNEVVMDVKTIREDDSRGRHTTTHRQLFMLPSGAMVIDTPGMRELGLFGSETSVSAGFADIEELFAKCRFGDCRHETEPGCAIREALANGLLRAERWERYLSQKRENRFVDNKRVFMKEKREFHKALSKYSKNRKKIDGAKL